MNKGIVLILAGFIGWGLFPLYWALLKDVSAAEVLAHRMLWSVPVLFVLIRIVASWRADFFTALKTPKERRWLLVTAILITVNWGVYILAVNEGRVVEASMGYFLSPLLHVLGGLIVFKERIGWLKQLAILLAALGVFYYILSVDSFPWIGLVVGVSFAGYGILRKMIKTSAVPGLLVETLFLAPVALAYLVYLFLSHQASFLNVDLATNTWIMLAGLVTVTPLVLFTAGSRLLPMTTSGILFYITPTMQFLVGALIFHEPINQNQLLGFIGIWLGLAFYTYASLRVDHQKSSSSMKEE